MRRKLACLTTTVINPCLDFRRGRDCWGNYSKAIAITVQGNFVGYDKLRELRPTTTNSFALTPGVVVFLPLPIRL
jgi:hypothetical protein